MNPSITIWYGVKAGSTAEDFAALHKAASDKFIFSNGKFPCAIVIKYDRGMSEPSKWRLGVTYRNEDAEFAYFTCKEFERNLSDTESLSTKWVSFPCEIEGELQTNAMTLDEAIEHAEEVAGNCSGQCAIDHIQLAAWLRELKARRASDDKLKNVQ